MRDKIGKMNSSFVWLFALAAVAVGIGAAWITSGMGTTISGSVYFGVFAVCGFLAAFLTRSNRGIAILAFIVAALVSGGVYYYLVSSVFTDAAAAAGTATATSASEEAFVHAAGASMGAALGLFAGVMVLIASLIAGICGILVGASQRKRFVAA